MFRLPNILFSSTRQWNCGDEFILFGIRRLLKAAGLSANFVLYNRHPGVNPQPRLWGRRFWRKSYQPCYDNSFFLDRDGLVDLAIFAGTPEWSDGVRVTPMLEYIVRNRIPTAFIGVGGHKPDMHVSALLETVLRKHCLLFVARDTNAYESVRGCCSPIRAVCPALFAVPEERVRKRNGLGRIGIVLQDTNTKWHAIAADTARHLEQCFRRLEKEYEVEYIAHYIDDWKYAAELGVGARTHYSSFSEDYVDIYDRFDAVVSTRVHGSGIAASLGIPSVLVAHDRRAETAKGFLATIISPTDDPRESLRQLDVPPLSAALLLHRKDAFRFYLELLTRTLGPVCSQVRPA